MQRLSIAGAEDGNTRIDQEPQHWKREQEQWKIGQSPVTEESNVPGMTLDVGPLNLDKPTNNDFAPTNKYLECSSGTTVGSQIR